VREPDFGALLAGARAGDEAAFLALFRSTQPLLLRYLTAVLGPSTAEDVAGDTWVDVVRGLDKFAGDESGWRAWVFTIARRRMRDEQRRGFRRPLPADAAAVLADRSDGSDAFSEVEQLIATEAALALIGRLPRAQAEVVLLRYVVGLDVAQTASVVGRRSGAVRVAAHRGLQRLAELLGPWAETGIGNAFDVMSDKRVT
jgi:RNA polymerase sigma-70 factor (ECF subfamily)